MTLVQFKYSTPDGEPASGKIIARPTRRHERDDRIILPTHLVIELDSNGEATADLAPTSESWVWQIKEQLNLTYPNIVYVIVPDQDGPIDFTDLVEVDPRSLQETATPEARWWAELRANNATAQEVRDIRDLVLPARDQTLAARDETLQHGITVDTSVGTRIFVGNTMIHGDTGWRDISEFVHEHWVVHRSFQITRVNDLVSLRVAVTRAETAPIQSVGIVANLLNTDRSSLWSGFSPIKEYGYSYAFALTFKGAPLAFDNSTSREELRLRSYGISLTGNSAEYHPGDLLLFSTSWKTTDPWPTSLPGTPA